MRGNEAGPGCLVSFGLIFFAVGVGVAGWGAYGLTVHWVSASWAKVPATIESVEYKVRPTKGRRRSRYLLTCRYSYEFEGKTYTGERLRVMGASAGYDEGEHRRRYEELRTCMESEKPFTALVDPDDPATAILYRDAGLMAFVMVPLGLLFAAIGAAVLWAAAAELRERRRRKAGSGATGRAGPPLTNEP